MQLIHHLGILSINKNVNENVGFLLTNKKGSYCSFFCKPTSKYYGFFYFDSKSMKMYKFIDNIEIVGRDNIDYVKNCFYFAERRKHDVIESFTMPKGFNSLIYELNYAMEIDLVLDCRESYDNRERGRFYDIFEEEDCIIVRFTKKTDLNEDTTDGKEEFSLYLAIRGNNNANSPKDYKLGKFAGLKIGGPKSVGLNPTIFNNLYEKNDKWVERHYADDERRNSPPFRRYIYNALRLKGTRFVFSISRNKKSAIKESEFVFNNIDELKQKEKGHFFNILKNENIKRIITNDKISKEIKIAYVSAANSLDSLAVEEKGNYGIMAGLPWFFQFWLRDSLISLKSLYKINNNFAEKILLNYLELVGNDGRLPNLVGESALKSLGSADAVGWLFLRFSHLADKINKDKETISSIQKSMHWIKQSKLASAKNIKEYIKRCNSIISRKEKEFFELLYKIENSLEKSINGLLRFHTKNNFDFNDANETWMDTDFGGDDRKGVRIELQALRLNMYRLAFELTQNHKYKVLENTLKIKVRQKFWSGKLLADGLDDFTIRPNVFIASYAYPELLSKKEWEACFENSLRNLWLDWGGVATIDKNNRLFTECSTGENNKSYHRGDSWFYLNNLAAIQLNEINSKKFQKNIQKILGASTEDILFHGCIGCASEISSAKEFSPTGCFNQAWSNAMYLELVDEVFR